jgi:hypothetical protein
VQILGNNLNKSKFYSGRNYEQIAVRECWLHLVQNLLSSSLLLKNLKIGPKRDEITGEWRKLHNVELNDLYSSPIIVRVINREE